MIWNEIWAAVTGSLIGLAIFLVLAVIWWIIEKSLTSDHDRTVIIENREGQLVSRVATKYGTLNDAWMVNAGKLLESHTVYLYKDGQTSYKGVWKPRYPRKCIIPYYPKDKYGNRI